MTCMCKHATLFYRRNKLPKSKTELARKVFKSIVCFKPRLIRNYLHYSGIQRFENDDFDQVIDLLNDESNAGKIKFSCH